ncbi:hypothetical protein Tco_0984470, partial [Tanacetum coccineum]
MAPLAPCEQRHPFLRYQGLEYSNVDIADFEERLERIHSRKTYRVQVVDFQGMPELVKDGLFSRMVMEHCDDAEFLSTLRFGEVLLDLDAPGTIQFQLGRARRRMSWREFILALGLHTGEEIESLGFDRSDVETLPSDDGMDVRSVNIPYLLARYLRRFADRRNSGAHISGGQFIAQLAEHFGLLTAEILGGLTVIAPELLIIDIGELMRLQIVVEDAPAIDEGDQAISAPMQAPQQPPPPPPTVARTMPSEIKETRGGGARTVHSMGLSEEDHLQHSRDAPGRGLDLVDRNITTKLVECIFSEVFICVDVVSPSTPEWDLLPITTNNLRIVSNGVKPPSDSYHYGNPPYEVLHLCGRPLTNLEQRDTPYASLNVVFSFVLTQGIQDLDTQQSPKASFDLIKA